ncbi:MAG: sn-glycerol-3-phosphate ABC transporter ATP-binding protein UgpC [Geminicoccaceae bacterium]
MAELRIEQLTKSYGNSSELAVDGVDLAVNDGEFMVLLGPSGCGKSSVLRMVAGLEPITSGSIMIDDTVVNEVAAKDRDIAMVFQSYALYPHMTVYKNLAFGLVRRGIGKAETEKRVRQTAERLGLSAFLDRRPHALSGGQRQRVALGRAIVREPKIFLFDEPLSNLDAALRVTTRNQLIRQQYEMGTTTVYVTHDQVEAMTMGHRVCIMNSGRVVQVGQPLEVYREPADIFVARFLGSPPMNIIPASLVNEGGRFHACFGSMRLSLDAWGERLASQATATVSLGIRPEDLYEQIPAEIAGNTAALPARVLAIEPLGAETLILLAVDGVADEITARVGRETWLRVGETASLHMDLSAVHLFHAETGRAIQRLPG